MSSMAFGDDSRYDAPRIRDTPRPIRLTRRGWVVLTALALALCLGVAWVTSTAAAGEPQHGIEVTRHAVVAGDTLWGLARSVATAEEDVRDVVAALERLNRLTSADLQIGQVVLLPAHAGSLS